MSQKSNICILLTRGRTGSTAIVSDLNQHSRIEFFQEIFSSFIAKIPYFETKEGNKIPWYSLFENKNTNQLGSINDYFDHINGKVRANTSVIGFKLLLNQLDEMGDSGLLEFVLKNKVPIIFLDRKPFNAAMSAAIAKERKIFNVKTINIGKDNVQSKMKCKPKVDFKYLISEITKFRHWSKYWLNFLSENDHPHVHLSYEMYCSDRIRSLNKVYNFLGIETITAIGQNEYVRMTSGNIWKDIKNPIEINFKYFLFTIFYPLIRKILKSLKRR